MEPPSLHEELSLPVPEPVREGATTSAFQFRIELADVPYTYPNASVPALDGLTMTIARGESVGLIGPSGSWSWLTGCRPSNAAAAYIG